MTFQSTALSARDVAEAQALLHEKGWTDGLPVVLPTEEAVAACLAGRHRHGGGGRVVEAGEIATTVLCERGAANSQYE